MVTLCSSKHHDLNGRIQAGKTQKPWHKLLPPWGAPRILQKLVRFYCNWLYICFLNKALSPKEEELNFLLHNTQHLEHSRQSVSVSWRKDGILCHSALADWAKAMKLNFQILRIKSGVKTLLVLYQMWACL